MSPRLARRTDHATTRQWLLASNATPRLGRPVATVVLRLVVAFALSAAIPLAAVAQAASATSTPIPKADSLVAFVDVNVLPMDRERVLERQTVVVRDGRIASIEPTRATRTPAGARRIDGRGKYLMPGLAEMHGHLPAQPGPFADNVMWLYVANGVTLVRGMLGNPFHLRLRDAIAGGRAIGPTLYLAGPALSGQQVRTPAAGDSAVSAQKAAGFDLLKIHDGLSRETYDVIVATARRVGIPFGGHVPDAVGVRHALASRQGTIDHMDNYAEEILAGEFRPTGISSAPIVARHPTPEQLASAAAATREAGVAIVPTNALWEMILIAADSATLAARPELRYMPRPTVAQWFARTQGTRASPQATARDIIQTRDKLLKVMSDSGALILLGTDSPQLFSVPGFSIHREMGAMSRAGMTNYKILESGTRSVGQYLGQHFGSSDVGTVEVGKRADLLLLDGNPVAELANVARRAGVMLRGRWIPEAQLRAKLSAIAAANGGG